MKSTSITGQYFQLIFLFLLPVTAIFLLVLWAFSPGDVVETKEKIVSEKTFMIEPGGKIPYDEYIPEHPGEDYVDDYVFLGQEKTIEGTGQEKQQIKIGKRIRHDVKGGSTYEVQELTINVEQGKQIPVIDTSDVRESSYIKLYFEDVKNNTLKVKAEKILIEEKRENQGVIVKMNDKIQKDIEQSKKQ